MHVWNGCRVGPGQTVCTFICSALYALELGGVIGDRCRIWGRNLTLVATMHNGDDGSALIFVRWMYEMGVVLARPGWTGRTFVLLRVSLKLKVSLVFNIVWSRNCILIYYTTMAMTVLHWTSFDECIWNGCRIVSGRTARTFVLLEFDTCYIVDHSTQYEVVISRSCAV